jgi:hypothetical protein
LDALAARVKKLTLQMATLVQGRRVGNARQAALPAPSTDSDDEGAGSHDSAPAAYGALSALPLTHDLERDWQVVDTSDPAYVAASHQQYLQATHANKPSVSEPAAEAAYGAQGVKHPMDAALEDEEYKARCAEYDAYRAQQEKEEEGCKWAKKLLDAWEERQRQQQNEQKNSIWDCSAETAHPAKGKKPI